MRSLNKVLTSTSSTSSGSALNDSVVDRYLEYDSKTMAEERYRYKQA